MTQKSSNRLIKFFFSVHSALLLGIHATAWRYMLSHKWTQTQMKFEKKNAEVNVFMTHSAVMKAYDIWIKIKGVYVLSQNMLSTSKMCTIQILLFEIFFSHRGAHINSVNIDKMMMNHFASKVNGSFFCLYFY